ncbi:MAG TPA: hypothetical protein VL595_32180 [Pseudonocardia sp.]|jgi:hypothetical protein|nr:hypothetical protein [Pseudonocardia sp.]
MTSSTDSTRETWSAAIRYITGRKAAEESLGFLAHVSGLLDTQPEPAAWGRAVAQVCVPYLVSGVSIDIAGVDGPVVEPGGRFEPVLAMLRSAAAGADDTPFVISTHDKLVDVSRTVAGVPDGLSAAVVRLTFRDHVSGQLAVVRTPEHGKGPLGPADLAVLAELANRVALGNAYTQACAAAAPRAGSASGG